MPETKPAKVEIPNAPVMMTPEAIQQLLMAVLQAAKEPTVLEKRKMEEEENAKAVKEAKRLTMRAEVNKDHANQKAKQAACPHIREDDTSVIAWYTFTNAGTPTRTVGYCPHCGRMVENTDPDFQALLARQSRRARL